MLLSSGQRMNFADHFQAQIFQPLVPLDVDRFFWLLQRRLLFGQGEEFIAILV